MKYRILRTFLCLSLLCLLLLACALPALAEEEGEEPPVITSGNSIVIYNVETDTFLFENDGTRSLAPTVVSKLMTAMIAADHYESLSAKVTVAAEALRDIGAAGDISAPRLGLTAGSEMTVEDLLCATLVSSANDAACALAYDISGGDMAAFVEEMNRRAGAQGVGRIDLIEDRLVGIKSRELYEAPGAVALITAHQELENCCLEREQHRIKRDIDKRWGELVYDAQWFSPATQSLNAFIEDTQKYVSGEIRMVLHGGRAVVTGRRSDSSLYDYKLATYDSGDTFDQKSSNGFIDIYGLPSRVAAARDVKFGNGIEVPENTVE